MSRREIDWAEKSTQLRNYEQQWEKGHRLLFTGPNTSTCHGYGYKSSSSASVIKEENRNRFSREAQTIQLLNHPNILKILDYSGRGCQLFLHHYGTHS